MSITVSRWWDRYRKYRVGSCDLVGELKSDYSIFIVIFDPFCDAEIIIMIGKDHRCKQGSRFTLARPDCLNDTSQKAGCSSGHIVSSSHRSHLLKKGDLHNFSLTLKRIRNLRILPCDCSSFARSVTSQRRSESAGSTLLRKRR